MLNSGYKGQFILGGITALLVGVIILFNDINIQIRMREVKLFLQRSNRSDNSIDHIGLVMKYRMHKDLYENRISPEEMNLIEVRINSVLEGMEYEKFEVNRRYRYATEPVMYVINFIRFLIGMPTLRDGMDRSESDYIDIAYFYERNRLYPRAIEQYQKIIENGITDRSLKAGVLLHLGYCHSILADYDSARKFYISVVKDFGDISIAVTAAILLRYIEGFHLESERIIGVEKDSVEKGEKLYKLMAYRESFNVLTRVEKTLPEREKSRIKFFKGRILEALGDTERAVDIYQDIIMKDSSSPYAIDSNQRIYIAGGTSFGGEKIRELAVKNSSMLNDNAFVKLVEEGAKYILHGKEDSGLSIKDKLSAEIPEWKTSGIVQEKKIEMMIRKVDARISTSGAKRLKGETPDSETMVKIYTTDGNIFTGTIVSDAGDIIVIRTSLGDITIEKSRVSRRINL